MAGDVYEKNDLISRNCPTCRNLKTTSEIHSTVNPLDLDYDSLSNLFIGYRKDQCFFSYYNCQICKTLFCKEYFNQNQLDTLYSRMPDNKFGLGDKAAFQTQYGYAKKIVKRMKKKSEIEILEVGPDLGLLSLAISKLIKVKRIVFVEPNIEVHPQLIENFINLEAEILIEEKISEVSKLEKFDLIVGVHVLDHLINPSKQISFFKSILAENGLITFVTHNYDSLLAKFLKKKWPPFCLQHPQLYSPKSLKNLAEIESLVFLGTEKTTNWLDLRGIMLRVLSIFGFNPKIRGISNIIFPVKLGNMVSFFEN